MRLTAEQTMRSLALFMASTLTRANADRWVITNSSNSSHLHNITDNESSVFDGYNGNIGAAVVMVIILIAVGVPLYVLNCQSRKQGGAASDQCGRASMEMP